MIADVIENLVAANRALVAEGVLYALASEAKWLDVGTPQRYLEANLSFAGPGGQVGDGGRIDPSARRTPPTESHGK